jgi:1-acyl-sn-glycerol-3-phosphate acyltransferase
MARDYGALYPVARAVLTPIFKAGWRVHTEGIDNVPQTGGAIVCPNHVSVLDSFFVPLVLPRRITYVGKAEYLDDWKTRFIFPAIGMIPIDRRGGDAAQAALDTAAGVLEQGELFGIYPEGTRSRSGKLHRGHTGAARLAVRTGSPILPVGLIGTREVQPPDAKLPNPFRPVWVRIGRPVRPGDDPARVDDHRLLRQITDEVMFEIGTLSGQEYVDEYANKKTEEPEIPRKRGGVITADGPSGNGAAHVAEVAKAG